jgi:hypothetical protein
MWTNFLAGNQQFAMWTAEYLNKHKVEGWPYATVEMTTIGCMLNFYLPWNTMKAWYKNHGLKSLKRTYTDIEVDEVTKFTWDVLSFWFADRGTRGNPLFISGNEIDDNKEPTFKKDKTECKTFSLIEAPQMMINGKEILTLKAKQDTDIIDANTFSLKHGVKQDKCLFEKGSSGWKKLDDIKPGDLLKDYTSKITPASTYGQYLYNSKKGEINKPFSHQDSHEGGYWGCLIIKHTFTQVDM